MCYNRLIMMYDNIYNTGRHMGNWGGGFNSGFGPESFGPAVWFGLSVLGILFIIWVAISLVLKAYALWTAARRGQKWWFIALLVVNSMGVLELVYLLVIAKVSWGVRCCGCGKCSSCKKCEGCNACESSDLEEIVEEPDEENIKNTQKEAEEVM